MMRHDDDGNGRLEICQMFYTTRFLGQKFYTLKMLKLELILPKVKQGKYQFIGLNENIKFQQLWRKGL